MSEKLQTVVLIAISALFLLWFFGAYTKYRQDQRIIEDQRTYIEAGCRGRYQGEE
jgi:hypothetical protein